MKYIRLRKKDRFDFSVLALLRLLKLPSIVIFKIHCLTLL